MRDLHLLLASVLLACLVWVMHTFSLEYTAPIGCSVSVQTQLPGYADEAVAREILVLRGKATGFYILKARGNRDRLMPVTLPVDARLLSPVAGEEGTFTLNVADVRDKLSEQLGDRFVIDFIETPALTFSFTPQAWRKVPVAGAFDLSFKPQYMQVGQVKFEPDSVMVHGDLKDLQSLREIRTHSISAKGVDKSLQGTVALDIPSGISAETDRVRYEVEVSRYVEMTMTLPVQVVNLPEDRSLMLLPSQVELTFKAPFQPRGGRINAEDISLQVDYSDFAGAHGTRMIPRLVTGREIFSWRISPEMIDCIVVE